MPEVFTFEILPLDDDAFEPMLLDIPTLSGPDFAARRAYWTAFHYLGSRGFDVDEFEVREYGGESRRITAGGFIPSPASSYTRPTAWQV